MTDIETLYDVARELTTDLLPRLAALIPHTSTPTESRIGSHGKALAAPLPWNDAAAMLYFEIHGDARRYEALLNQRLFGHTPHRAGTDAHTTECVNRLPVLIAHGRDQDTNPDDLHTVTRSLLAWPRQIRTVLDEPRAGEERWANAPGGITCPNCTRPLKVPPGFTTATDIRLTCLRCVDDDGNRITLEPTEWLGRLNQLDAYNADDLVTADRAKRLFPHVRRNTIDVWAHRAIETPHIAPIPARGLNKNGLPLFRVGDIEDHLAGNDVCALA